MSFARLLTSCLGSGFLRPAPGTIGSAFALGVYVLLLAGRPLAWQVAAVVVASAVGVWASTTVARELADGDPSEVVIDELAGMWLALLGSTTLPAWLAAFFLFRLFDVLKPFPANVAEGLPEGWGIMTDDLVAGVYALLAVRALDLWVFA